MTAEAEKEREMFKNLWKAIKEFFVAPPIRTQFEEIILQEEIKKMDEVKPAVADYVPSHGGHATPKEDAPKEEVSQVVSILAEPVHGAHSKPVEDQITDSVTIEKTVKPKRAKTAKGKFKADDKSTPEVNEAWEGGIAPAKKPRAPRKKKEV